MIDGGGGKYNGDNGGRYVNDDRGKYVHQDGPSNNFIGADGGFGGMYYNYDRMG